MSMMRAIFDITAVRAAAIAIVGAVALGGCSGGAETTPSNNPPGSGAPDAGAYSGPPAASADIQAFSREFWTNIRGTNRCGNCHTAGGQAPTFARSDDVNLAYEAANGLVSRDNPSLSLIVTKVGGGHNCWLADAGSCATILSRWITAWVGASATAGRQIELVAPEPKDPGASRRLPDTPPSSFTALHTLLTGAARCSGCHRAQSATAQSPYFASADINEAYIAALPKINLDDPASSRFVLRLRNESHNCWTDNCGNDAQQIQNLIAAMATEIGEPEPMDPNLVVSKALSLYEGTIAAGGNRYDNDVIALYEFKTGAGNTVFDTSGIDPAADLNLAGQRGPDFDWVGGWGVVFKSRNAKAQASTASSRKFHQLITTTGEYSIEAWVIPGNVTQEDAHIISYSGGTTTRNFTIGQTMYNYDFFSRSSATGANGTPQLSTADDDERLQAGLQHIVMTFDPVNGRRIYVNAEFTGDADGAGGGSLGEWDNSFAFVLGNEVSNNRPWSGIIRMVAVHDRALTDAQIRQNFEAGVGEKYFLLFGVEHITNMSRSYVLFEAAEYDSFGYLFSNPRFISLDGAAMPGSIRLRGMRIGVNGAEPHVGQAYRLLDTTITDAGYTAANGFKLSDVGTIIAQENGPRGNTPDQFFLCFDQLGSREEVCSDFANAVPTSEVDLPGSSDIGVRTFDAINATMASMTGIGAGDARVRPTFTKVRQSLPAVKDIQGFLSSHQTSIAQLALQYCNVMVSDGGARANFFTGVNFNTLSLPADSNAIVTAIVNKTVGTAGATATTQPRTAVETELGNLIADRCTSACTGTRAQQVVVAACGAALGSAATLVQ